MSSVQYFMESPTEGRRIDQKTDRPLTLYQVGWAGLKAGSRVIDVGCAAGTTTDILADWVGPTGTVTGIDASAERIEDARRGFGRQGVSFHCGQAQSLAFDDGQFDFAWCRFLFEYLPERQDVLAELIRVVRAGGAVCISDLDGNGTWTEPLTAALRAERDEAVAALMTTGFDPHVGRRLFTMAVAAGLENVRVDVRPYNVMAGAIGDAAVRERWELKHRAIEAALIKLGWPSARAQAVIAAFHERLNRPDTFSYSVLVTVVGEKPQAENFLPRAPR